MAFVLDCSMTMAWVFSDESTPRTEALLRALRTDSAIVPTLWPMEVANVLLVATRRGRIQRDEWSAVVESLTTLPVETDTESHGRAFSAALPLADAHGLSVYDAAYLELAVRRELPLATLDKGLARACGEAGIEVL